MINRVKKVKLLKDVPGANAGTEIEIHSSGVLTGEGTYLRGANVGTHFYWEGEFEKHPDFFEIEYVEKKP